MAVSVTYRSNLTVVETLADAYLSSSANNVTHNGLDSAKTLNSGTTVPATKVASFSKALSSGTGTIDFTALPGTNGATVTGLGLKVQALKLRGKSTNTGAITIVEGASNGIALLAATSGKIAVAPNAEVLMYFPDSSPDIASGDRTLDLTGTGSEELEVTVVMG